MASGRMLAFTNATSPEREEEFNRWYDGTHRDELTALPGVGRMSRFRAVAQAMPSGAEPAYKYLAMFELEDIQTALAAFGRAAATMKISDSMDLQNALVVIYEDIVGS